ncbi:MAG: protein O-mannosyl-transferase family [Dysgonomonas sp.]
MKKYNLINNILGWLSFAIAATVYLMTIEPTASFWDCGEFITSAYKLEVGHPPGAPFFMLTGKFFTLFASDPSQVGMMVNAMSALLSALTILFLFWTITHLAKKLIYSDNSKEMTTGQLIAIMGSGLVGALTYTFTDTFWFSAVEGEVYAYSSMFTALVFWLILKWESAADKPHSDKWLVLIAYTMGLSIGVHLLNLLCIPAIVLVYYFKRTEKATVKGTCTALLLSFAFVVILMYGVIPGFTKVGGWFELLFVNTFGLPYNTGIFVYLILLVISIIWCVYETMSKKGNLKRAKISFLISIALAGITFIGSSPILWILLFLVAGFFLFYYKKTNIRVLNTSILCLMVILIGYSSFALIPIRSAANTPMDQNSPEDVFSLTDYLNREQYGDTPLFYGRTYASDVERDREGRPVEASVKKRYDKVVKTSENEKDRYFVAGTTPTYKYTNSMLFPRMHSSDPRHIEGYKMWGDIKDEKVPPTMLENFKYFFNYQINFMYWRYFMWNFSGRQNDVQSMGGINNGNWITGIGFIDEMRGLGPQDNLPPSISENKGHNVYYMLPLILGIIGIVFQITRKTKGEQQFLVTFMLFFMTGLAIVIYLNQKPFEPRERDYAYAGSFYAFCIWIGFGVAGLWTLLKKAISSETLTAAIATIAALFIPIQMAGQNWDDHDRSGRTVMRDFGMNYLRSCEPNAILFTNGDNDTFPLWYAQEVEGFRTDVRVCNLSYLQTDWYVDQMRRQAYDSEPLPITWTKDRYIGDKGIYAYILTKDQIETALRNRLKQEAGSNWMNAEQSVDYGRLYDRNAFKETLPLNDVMTILKTKDTYIPNNPFINEGVIVPTNKLTMPLDSSKIDWKALDSKPAQEMVINLGNKSVIYRNDIMILEMLNNINKDGWKRPIYYAATVGSDMYLNLRPQFLLEGVTYRITPGRPNPTGVNTEVAYDNMVNKYKWGGIENPKVYLDENTQRMAKTFRFMFIQVIDALIKEGKMDKALTALNTCVEKIPHSAVPFEGESIYLGEFYYKLGQPEKAEEVLGIIQDRMQRTINWYNRLTPQQMANSQREIAESFDTLLRVASVYNTNGKHDKYKEIVSNLQSYSLMYFSNGNGSLGSFGLKTITDDAIQSYQMSNDTSFQKQQEEVMQKTLGLMQQYSPALLKEYYGSQQ